MGSILNPLNGSGWMRKLNLIEIGYGEDTAEYSFNLKPLDAQMGKIPCEIAIEDRERIRLKEELFRLLGYDALKELERGIGSNYGILVGFDNGKTPEVASFGLRYLKARAR
ncbi:MAG: hypothetical protein FGF52_03410 [Candidatus Brockarchaeota archaeon]|nr:hypothetical protein [Candidatus Brockarchaeota archaeon]